MPKECKMFDFYKWSLLNTPRKHKIGVEPTENEEKSIYAIPQIFSEENLKTKTDSVCAQFFAKDKHKNLFGSFSKYKYWEKDALLMQNSVFDSNIDLAKEEANELSRTDVLRKFFEDSAEVEEFYSKNPNKFRKIGYRTSLFSVAKKEFKKMSFNPFEAYLVAVDEDNFINVWDYRKNSVNSFKNGNTKTFPTDFDFVNFYPKMIIAASNDGTARVWKDYHRSGYQSLVSAFWAMDGIAPSKDSSMLCERRPFSNQIIFAGSNGKLCLWDLDTEKKVKSINLRHRVYTTTLFPDRDSESIVYLGTNRGDVEVLDLRIGPPFFSATLVLCFRRSSSRTVP
ncbi:Target of rapamycin complex 1 subunit kog1 [Bonamia ostreae]|uniref:Target of rapamycin complex 1 subunit kog1 n=1 Tax=Bonamia ostreae TaxID=126728 RepID=A0ABV2AH24_9EUKA